MEEVLGNCVENTEPEWEKEKIPVDDVIDEVCDVLLLWSWWWEADDQRRSREGWEEEEPEENSDIEGWWYLEWRMTVVMPSARDIWPLFYQPAADECWKVERLENDGVVEAGDQCGGGWLILWPAGCLLLGEWRPLPVVPVQCYRHSILMQRKASTDIDTWLIILTLIQCGKSIDLTDGGGVWCRGDEAGDWRRREEGYSDSLYVRRRKF